MDQLFIRIFEAKITTIDQNWNSRDVRNPYWRFYVNSRDGASVDCGGQRTHLIANQVFLVPAWVSFSCHNRKPVEHLYAHFDVVGLSRDRVEAVFDRPFALKDNRQMQQYVQNMRRLMREQPVLNVPAMMMLKSMLYLSVALLWRQVKPEPAIASDQDLASVLPAIRYIEDHLHLPLANRELARECQLSEDHFIRRFRESVGQTPAQYVIERRVAAAAQMLILNDDDIDAIARQTGFPNRAYFSRVFAQRMGLPPAKYRKASLTET